MNPSLLSKVLEHLRQGAPPYGMSSHFTVGSVKEIRQMEKLIGGQGPILIEADSGCGKSHVLDHLREKALEQGFVVSVVSVDSEQEVRFNLLDQVVGAVFRGLEIPGTAGIGVPPFMDAICKEAEDSRFTTARTDFWAKLTNDWKWDQDTHVLESPALYIALRAWRFGRDDAHSLIEDWLGHPWRYYKDRKNLVRYSHRRPETPFRRLTPAEPTVQLQ